MALLAELREERQTREEQLARIAAARHSEREAALAEREAELAEREREAEEKMAAATELAAKAQKQLAKVRALQVDVD